MSMPQIPRLTIYEDFDKIYGKEVCFGQSGEKIIVKLLHFGHLKEDQQQLLMSDESGTGEVGSSENENTSPHPFDPHQSIPKQRKKSSSKKKLDEQRKISLSKINLLKGETSSTQSDTPVDFLKQIKGISHHSSPNNRSSCAAGNGNKGGYAQYEMSFLQVPVIKDYGEASSDDLSSEWDSDQTDVKTNNNESKPVTGWRKLRNIVTWTPFFQTYKKQRYAWVQLAGHQGNFKAGKDPGTVLKKSTQREADCFNLLMKDVLRAYTPQFFGIVKAPDAEDSDDSYLQLQDLLTDFKKPCCVMDLKIGLRTYLIEELEKAKEKQKLRKDMYEKMIQIDVNAPTEEENLAKGVTKPRYMCWRETISSTATLGFRIEGIKKDDGTTSKDFKTLKQRSELFQTFKDFVKGYEFALPKYIQRLKAIRATVEFSEFFRTHEIIGSSLLFVHDTRHASIWLIDFAKTIELPENTYITHDRKWEVGNHEDGYLIGLNNLIEIFSELFEDINGEVVERKNSQSSSSSDGKN